MKIYIAAPWKDKELMPAIADRVEGAGHSITHKWWLVENTPESDRTVQILRDQALKDVLGVKESDLVLVINSAKSEGKSLEQGVAIGDNKPIVIVGKRGEFSMNVFHYLDNYRWVETVGEALEVLDTIQWLTSHEGV